MRSKISCFERFWTQFRANGILGAGFLCLEIEFAGSNGFLCFAGLSALLLETNPSLGNSRSLTLLMKFDIERVGVIWLLDELVDRL